MPSQPEVVLASCGSCDGAFWPRTPTSVEASLTDGTEMRSGTDAKEEKRASQQTSPKSPKQILKEYDAGNRQGEKQP